MSTLQEQFDIAVKEGHKYLIIVEYSFRSSLHLFSVKTDELLYKATSYYDTKKHKYITKYFKEQIDVDDDNDILSYSFNNKTSIYTDRFVYLA